MVRAGNGHLYHRKRNLIEIILSNVTKVAVQPSSLADLCIGFIIYLNSKKMEKNIETADKVIRILAAILIAGLYYANLISGTVAILLLILAGIFIITSFVGFCPIYRFLGISTLKSKKQ